jgi:hypothetical protein
VSALRLELSDEDLQGLAKQLSELLRPLPAPSPWMNFEALCEYTSIPGGTLRKMSAAGDIPSHGGRIRLYHRDEVDEALLGYSRRKSAPELRRIA